MTRRTDRGHRVGWRARIGLAAVTGLLAGLTRAVVDHLLDRL
jgi:hypothetical protein